MVDQFQRSGAQHPDCFGADEPTGNLDSEKSLEIMSLLHGLNRDAGISIVMVTHEPDMAAFAAAIVHFKDGMVERVEQNADKRKATGT